MNKMRYSITILFFAVAMVVSVSAYALYGGPRGGIAGIAVGLHNGDIVVERVMSGTGADRAGLVEGDVIVAIDGVPTGGKPLGEVERVLEGGVGSDVAIGIRGLDGAERIVRVIREEVMGSGADGLPVRLDIQKPHDLRPEAGAVCSIESLSGRTAVIGCGEDAGVDPRQQVQFVHREDYADAKWIAKGRVTKVMDTTAKVAVGGNAKAIDPKRDIAVTSAWRSERARENTLWRVAVRGIVLLDYPTGLPYATIDQLRFDTEMALEKAAVTKMAQRLREAADVAHKVYSGRISKGKFRGKSLAGAFRDTTPQDVMTFLGFLNTYPDKYVGREWSLPEIYATWILNGTPNN
jgi:hypothetical protein